MNNIPDHIDELIGSYLAGEATPEQAEVVERWKEAAEENRKYFEHLKLIFQTAAATRHTISVDTDQAWNRLRDKLSSGKTVRMRPNDGFSPLKIAAGLILLVAAGIFIYQNLTSEDKRFQEILADKETRSDTLPGGSAVFLNRHTRIGYEYNKRTDTHLAKLTGEAYFDVRHDKSQTFIVVAGETLIKDIGTSFNVKAYPESNMVEVVVDEGEVQFYRDDNPGIRIRAGERGLYDRTSGIFSAIAPDPNITAYKTRAFTFDNRTLGSVVMALNSVYDTSIVVDEHLEGCKLTVAFQEENIDEIASVIAETLGLSIAREGKTIQLHGDGCGEAPME